MKWHAACTLCISCCFDERQTNWWSEKWHTKESFRLWIVTPWPVVIIVITSAWTSYSLIRTDKLQVIFTLCPTLNRYGSGLRWEKKHERIKYISRKWLDARHCGIHIRLMCIISFYRLYCVCACLRKKNLWSNFRQFCLQATAAIWLILIWLMC